MTRKMASLLAAYGIVLIALALLLRSASPHYAGMAWIVGVAGGALSLLWAGLGLGGYPRRSGAILTGATVALFTIFQAVQTWLAHGETFAGRWTSALVLTAMLATTTGILMYLLHGERSPEFYQIKAPVDKHG